MVFFNPAMVIAHAILMNEWVLASGIGIGTDIRIGIGILILMNELVMASWIGTGTDISVGIDILI